jgi:hypothetical protein
MFRKKSYFSILEIPPKNALRYLIFPLKKAKATEKKKLVIV